jgi:hypothetical protein
MNTFYTAYTRDVQGKTFYFVKKYSSFPEFAEVPDILENYGMHTNFNLACKIASLKDGSIKQKLLRDIEFNGVQTGMLIQMTVPVALGAAN